MIETLKAQIGELMKGQSAERQQQIAELRKKLVNAAQEANELRYLLFNAQRKGKISLILKFSEIDALGILHIF